MAEDARLRDPFSETSVNQIGHFDIYMDDWGHSSRKLRFWTSFCFKAV